MRYLWSASRETVFEIDESKGAYLSVLIDFPDIVEVDYETVVMNTFIKISTNMGRKFINYINADIAQECFYMLLKRYRTKGIFAPDKPWIDNERIWWSFAKKSCFYIIRKFKEIVSDIDIWDIDDNEQTIDPALSVCDNYDIGESEAYVKDIYDTIFKLYSSGRIDEERMGQFALCKARGLTDKETAKTMGLSMPRIYEIKRALKKYFNIRFGNIV